jgi:CubicO group peptidase (beta-lactamase class C family)
MTADSVASETSLHYATVGTTVRHLLDMRSGIGFREDYLDARAEPTNKQIRHGCAGCWSRLDADVTSIATSSGR